VSNKIFLFLAHSSYNKKNTVEVFPLPGAASTIIFSFL
jgi:hypothetical protein